MLVVTRFTGAGDELPDRVRDALAALGERPGFVRGRLGRSTDEPGAWVLVTEWDGVGAYRRALSSYDVRVRATPVLAEAVPEASAYETVLSLDGPSGAGG